MSSSAGPKLSRLSILYLIFSAITGTGASSLFSRQDATCGGNTALLQCGNDFPSEFCCPKDTSCTRVNVTSVVSAICCPKGMDCSFIQPITCDVTQLDAKLHPDNQIHLANTTDVQLPKCGGGDKCCPLGYKCNGETCIVDKNLSSPPTSSTASSTTLPTSSPSPSVTEAPSASQTTEAPPAVQTQQGFDGKSFAAGFFPGIVLGALMALGLLWVIKKRRESQEKNRYSGDFGHVRAAISDPIYDPVYAARTDFIRRTSGSAQPSPNSTTEMVVKNSPAQVGGLTPKIKSMWERTPKLGFGGFGGGTQFAHGLPANPSPAAFPAVRAGNNATDPYKTPTRTPTRTTSTSRRPSMSRTSSIRQQNFKPQRPITTRSTSTETIDVLMRPPSFLAPPKAPAMRENRFTQDSGHTTFTKLMERAGYDEESRNNVNNWNGSPGRAR